MVYLSFVDTVDRFQGQESNLIIASYTVADRDFVVSEVEFILDPPRFNVTLAMARGKFIMFVSVAVFGHLPSNPEVARVRLPAAFRRRLLFGLDEWIVLPFSDRRHKTAMPGRLRDAVT